MLECTHADHGGERGVKVHEEGKYIEWTFSLGKFHAGPGKWLVNIEYPCCGHEGRKFEVWCETWTDTIFNQSGIPVKCPWCFHMFEDTSENVKIIGLA